MKVLHLLGTGQPGGVESFVLQLIRDIPRDEAEMSVCIVGADGPISDALREAGAAVHFLERAGTNKASRAAGFLRIVGGDDYDVIHASSGGRLLRLLSSTGRASIISHLHGIEQTWLTDVESRGRGLRRRVSELGTGADVIAVSSQWMHKLLIDGSCRRPIVRLSYGVDTRKFSPAERTRLRRSARDHFRIADGTKIVGFVGRLVEQKGPQHLLALARELALDSDVAIIIVGDGPARESMESEAQDSQQTNLHFAGAALNIPLYMAAFDVAVMPSEWEPFGIVALEAAAMGIPVVAFDVGGIREGVVHGETGLLVQHRDVPALANACRRLLSEEELATRLGEHGRKRVEQKFDSQLTSAKVVAHYRDLLIARGREV